jgi:nitrogen fixation/metabolism regulation signal transduction histidine kinase
MSIRVRLVLMCLVVALLPAAPLTLLVKSLLDKSFDVGLNPKFEEAFQSGLSVSRQRLDDIRSDFQLYVQRVIDDIGDEAPDSVEAAAAMARVVGASGAIDGLLVSSTRTNETVDSGTGQDHPVPAGLRPFAGHPVLRHLHEGTTFIDRQGDRRTAYSFYDTQDRTAFVAAWYPESGGGLFRRIGRRASPGSSSRSYGILFYKVLDHEFIADAERLIEGRQMFATLKLTQRSLAESFFLPFVIIYSVCLLIALGLALFMAERMAEPIRRLVRGTGAVAGGDWGYRLDAKTGGETGRLVAAFNSMVARLEAQRRRLTDMEKMATWRDMARHLAHEIKNPLLPIRLTIEELRDQYTGDDARYRELLKESTRVVSDELGSLQKLVKEFSAFARMPDMNPQMGSFGQLVRDVAQLYPQVETQVETQVEPQAKSADTHEFPFDADQIRRVLVNLFDNAASVGATRVKITLSRTDGEMTMTLGDNGPGIPAEDLGKIFDPYFTTRSQGTGLGLAMAKKIVLLHGGSISAASSPGKGVTFEIRLPLSGPPAPTDGDGGSDVDASL